MPAYACFPVILAGSPQLALAQPANSPQLATDPPTGSSQLAADLPAGSLQLTTDLHTGLPQFTADIPAGSSQLTVASPAISHRRKKNQRELAVLVVVSLPYPGFPGSCPGEITAAPPASDLVSAASPTTRMYLYCTQSFHHCHAQRGPLREDPLANASECSSSCAPGSQTKMRPGVPATLSWIQPHLLMSRWLQPYLLMSRWLQPHLLSSPWPYPRGP